jgi:hypothetical protein
MQKLLAKQNCIINKTLFRPLSFLFLILLAFQTINAQLDVEFGIVREVNTGIRWGGRTYSLAVNPANADIVLAATETGGIKKTMNRGVTWSHLTNFPCNVTNDIAYTDATGNNIIVTTRDDFKATNGAGIWRSEDGGDTWTQCFVRFTNPAASCNGRMIAWNITKSSNRILVATECGIAISIDGGRTFIHNAVAGIQGRFSSIAASGSRVIIGGSNGIFHSENEGDDFTREITGIGNVSDFHAMTWSDDFGAGTRIAYAINSAFNLYYSTDGGQRWSQIATAPRGGGGCGGRQFISAIKTGPASQKLYYGNRCNAFLLNSSRLTGSGNDNFNYMGSWDQLRFQHGSDINNIGLDCYQIAFDNSVNPATPYMLATDGGVEGTSDAGLNWVSIGKASSGFNALQVTDVKGQLMAASSDRNQTLYFATQDNDLWSSNNGGRSFPNRRIFEGDNLQMARMAGSYSAKIHYMACGDCFPYISNPHFRNEGPWPDVPNRSSWPFMLKEGVFMQYHGPSPGSNQGISIIRIADGTWRNLVDLNGDLRGRPKLARTASGHVLYQGIRTGVIDDRTGADRIQLAKINNFDETGTLTPSLTYADMRDFGSFGVMVTAGLPGLEVYDVDYNNPNNMIAADYTNRKMKRSTDGGNSWIPLDALTDMITDGGRLNFRFSKVARFGIDRYTQASLVSYHPDIPDFVIVGTQEGGVFFSSDNGDNWVKIPGSEQITSVSSAYWASANKIYIGTYGRGLWEIDYEIRSRFEDLLPLCKEPCFDFADPETRLINPILNEAKLSSVLLVRGGVLNGWRLKANRLAEIMVTPGTQVVFYDKQKNKEPVAIQITETEKDGKYEGANELVYEQLKLQKNIQGLSIREGGIGEILLTSKMIERIQPEPVKFIKDFEKLKPDNEGMPLIYLKGQNMLNGMPVLPAGENEIVVSGFFFISDKTPVEIFVDDKLYTTAYANQSGEFSVPIKGNFDVGSHSVKAIQKTNKGEISYTSYFQCRNTDGK